MTNDPEKTNSSTVGPIGLFLRGLAMGAADVVPGVSGGTIAFITGIYSQFINALRSVSPLFLLRLGTGRIGDAKREFRAIHWQILLPVGAGVALAILLLSKTILELMDDKPGATYALFFGLILASAWLPFKRMNQPGAMHLGIALITAIGAWLVVGLQPDGIQVRVIEGQNPQTAEAVTVFYGGKIRQAADLDAIKSARDAHAQPDSAIAVFDPKGVLKRNGISVNTGDHVFTDKSKLKAWIETKPSLLILGEHRVPLGLIFLYGLIAISAMVLPGLSGSFLLLFLGVYHSVFTAIHQCKDHLLALIGKAPNPITALNAGTPMADFVFLGVFGLGVLLGLVTFSRVVAILFEKAHDATMAGLIGLMIGALHLPGAQVLTEVNQGQTKWAIVLIVGLVGASVVLGLNALDNRRTHT
jgi:uncharacterized membrane protein